MEKIGNAKIEVDKNNGHFFFTGMLYEDDSFYKINTIKKEVLIFRKEQVVQIDLIGDDMNGKNNKKYMS